MPDGALAEDAPGTRNHIVRGHARRLVEDQQAVHFPTITARSLEGVAAVVAH